MKSALLAASLLISGAAIAQDAQTSTQTEVQADTQTTTTTTTTSTDMGVQSGQDTSTGTHAGHGTMTTSSATGQTVAPGNQAPERDARGIPVVSDPAEAPAGFNRPVGMGGPVADASSPPAPQPATENYATCSRTVTDNCVQAYERGSSPR
jgi:hypothetical protein